MKSAIPLYTFHKTKYGSELLIDVVELKYVKRFLTKGSTHTLAYYDITLVTEGEGDFSIDNHTYPVAPCDVVFSKPGEIRHWDTNRIVDGFALIFEDEFLSSFFKDSAFVQHLPYFKAGKTASQLHLSNELYNRMLQLLHDIKAEIDSYEKNGTHLLRALLYEALMLLSREYENCTSVDKPNKELSSLHIDRFIQLVETHLKEESSVHYYAGKLCITPNYLNELVHAAMNISAKQYIQNKRMDEAKRLLTYTTTPISDIAFGLHFSTVSYFVRSFRQCTGETPLAYRQSHKP